MKAKLTIVATPIGNLNDITKRALDTLKDADFILCEDTRVTKKLLTHFDIKTPTKTYHHHSNERIMREILDGLRTGKQIALVSDAGTPGISDPGNILIDFLVKNADFEIEISPIPGASAVVSALSISGFATDKYVFMGFIPHKNKRKQFIQEIENNKYTSVFFESNHRIEKLLKEMPEIISKDRRICICRELTKKFETVYRGTVGGVGAMPVLPKGEFVVIVEK